MSLLNFQAFWVLHGPSATKAKSVLLKDRPLGGNLVEFLRLSAKLVVFIVVLACHSPELDWFNQHFQATVHFPLTIAVD